MDTRVTTARNERRTAAARVRAVALYGVDARGRTPLHALTIGFFGSMLVAMVTRVSQGHPGRPLETGPTAWFAFAGMQLVAVLRVAAEWLPSRPAGCWLSCPGSCAIR